MIPGLDRYKKKWNITTDPAIKPGLDSITAALKELGNPQKEGTYIHLAGSNGKGSTAAFLTAIFKEHHLSVGSFMSPHIEDLHDQIQLNGKPVTPDVLDQAMEQLANIRTLLTDFELLTAAAFLVFKNEQPDVIILEAGMGGRFDSTNVITPAVAIIPSVSLEHTNFLGPTIGDIAWHKAGVIKVHIPIIIGDLPEEAEAVIRKEAKKLTAPVVLPEGVPNVSLKLKGAHQQRNAMLAQAAAAHVLGDRFDAERADRGLAAAFIPNRFEEVAPNIFFDGAHNPASVEKLVETVKTELADRPIHVYVGILKDKDYITILRKLEEISDNFTFVDFPHERAMVAKNLYLESKGKVKTIQKVCDILPVLHKNEVALVTGSLYLLAEIRHLLINRQDTK
ncbi:bifunctional folylpolyglutamate synthase/dihydrofolate synthase [Planococcus lenghuensis]|uniref:tetrahydrofolate synthase n=1 Tax=Planococcus lenghuensis TaxID=2213202 RepID=A0A1Q2KXK6_9BACL|nr:folylpolyglutamate synthase/dihydrofolate synthase family protein [Planococcus lenghuensis]AQQ52883.1 bifunctional folylpolyglutamate synthase/dihydrofolate synthase [Planococcus lenghuensis]